jgi:hypothetical protein
MHFEERALTTGSQTFTISHQPDTTQGSERRGLTMLTFRSDVFEGVETADVAGETSTTNTSPQTKVSLTTAAQSSEYDYVYLAVMNHDDGGTGDGLNGPSYADIRHAGNPTMSSTMRIDRNGNDTNINWAWAERTTGSQTIDGRYWSSGSTVDAIASYAHIVALRYIEPIYSLAAEASNCSYSYERQITVDYTKVGLDNNPGIISDFPVLVNLSGRWLRTTTDDPTYGRIENANGWDIIFKDSSGNQLAHEIEKYGEADVTLIDDNWSTGSGAPSGLSYTVPEGNNRLLVFVTAIETDDGNRTIGPVSFGGASMTFSGASAWMQAGATQNYIKIEIWYLKEADIPSGSQSFDVTYTPALSDLRKVHTWATYQNVDQDNLIVDNNTDSNGDPVAATVNVVQQQTAPIRPAQTLAPTIIGMPWQWPVSDRQCSLSPGSRPIFQRIQIPSSICITEAPV